MDEFQATQILQKRRENEQRGNQPAEAGIVESVTCSDFMCHSFLHVELGPLINFIIGHNGSGKSAVLTALTISLGGKASATNRGGSLKSFIKEGQESGLPFQERVDCTNCRKVLYAERKDPKPWRGQLPG